MARAAVGFSGYWYLLTGTLLLLAPLWFYEVIGHFPPFNRHYMGDTGAFLLPLGLGLAAAARDPLRHRLIIRIGTLASLLHTGNHIYDLALERASALHWLIDLGPLSALALALLAVELRFMRESR